MAAPMTAAQTRAQMGKWRVPFKEHPGWTTNKRPGSFAPVGIVIHHTGSDGGQNSASYDRFLFDVGRPAEGIPGPLCQAAGEMDGDIILGAIGRANHAGSGSASTLKLIQADSASLTAEIRPGADGTNGNGWLYGLEVKFDGGQPMTSKQYDSAVRWAAAICDFYGWTAGSIVGHKEWSSRKPDPGHTFMAKFRQDVNARLKAGPGGAPSGNITPPTAKDWFDVATPAEIESAMTKGTLNALRAYGSALFKNGSGTADAIWDQAKAGRVTQNAKLDSLIAVTSAQNAKLDQLIGAIGGLTEAIRAQNPQA